MRPPTPTPLARREALRRQLALALTQRDPSAVLRLSTQWAHRHGVTALEPLMLDLVAAEPTAAPGEASAAELLSWWRQLLREPVAPADPRQAPGGVSPAPEPAPPAVLTLSGPSPIGAPPSDAPPSDAPSTASPSTGARVLPFPQASARRRPAPAPAHPGLASLRAWLSTPAVASAADPSAADPSAAAVTPEELHRAA